jgi:hypothetical protein
MAQLEFIRLDGRLPEGYVLICYRRGEAHCFLIRQLSISVECPECGATALASELAAAYYEQQASARRGMEEQ